MSAARSGQWQHDLIAQERRVEPVDELVFPEGPVDDELPALIDPQLRRVVIASLCEPSPPRVSRPVGLSFPRPVRG